MDYALVHMKARAVHDNANGTYSLEIPCKPLTESQARALEELFPNVRIAVDDLLAREMILGAIATSADLAALPQTKKEKKY